MNRPRFLLMLALLLPTGVLAELEIIDAWIKNLPSSVPVRAGYMTLHNRGPSAVSIVAVRSEAFARVEIHRSVMQDGMMRMDPVDNFNIEAGASRQLAPGGYHLMMMQALHATRPGEEIDVVLQLDDGSEQHLKMKVVK